MIKAAIIGITGYGGFLYSLSKKHVEAGDLKWEAAVSLPSVHCPETKAELTAQGCKIYSSAEEMFAEMKGKLDLIFIPTSIGSHCPLTIGALSTGAHVIVEKPAAGIVAEIDKMIEAEKKAPKTVSVGFQDIYRPEVQKNKEKLVSGEFGKVKAVKVTGNWPRGIAYYTRNHWAGKIKDGDSFIYDSPANNALAHYLNLSLFLAGSEYGKSAVLKDVKAELYRVWDIESFDTISLKAVTDKDVEIIYSVTHATTEEEHPIVTVECEKGTIHFDWDETYITTPDGDKIPDADHVGTNGGRYEMYKNIIARASGKDVFTCSLDIAKAQTQLINDIHNKFEIKTVPQKYWKEVKQDGDTFRAIDGINDIVNNSVKEGKLFSEYGVEW